MGVEYDTLTLISGFLVPLISFLLGFVFSILRDKFRERSTRIVTASFFFLWLDKTIKSGNALAKELENLKQKISTLDGFQIAKPTFINLHLNRLASDQSILFSAFVKAKKGKLQDNFSDYSTLFIDLDFLDDFQKMLLQNFQYIIDDFQNAFTRWNDAVRALHRAKHILVGRRAKNADEKINLINNKFNEWYEMDDQGLSVTYNFLNALEPMLQKFYNEDPSDDELAELLSKCQQTKVLYSQFLSERNQVFDLISKFHEQLVQTVTEITSLSLKVKMKENKRFYI